MEISFLQVALLSSLSFITQSIHMQQSPCLINYIVVTYSPLLQNIQKKWFPVDKKFARNIPLSVT